MLGYVEYLSLPTKVVFVVVCLLFIMQFVGEIVELTGKTVPEILKIRKYFKRKKEEREALKKVPFVLDEVKKSLVEFDAHYSKDNIQKRNAWIEAVNSQLKQNSESIKKFDETLDKSYADILALLIDNKRNTIINFASFVIDDKNPVTREQFNRVFKLYEEYEDIIEKNGMTNGEVDIAYRIITESYEEHMRNHSFVENVRGYEMK